MGQKPIEARLRQNVLMEGDGCWIWRGRTSRNGYGRIRFRGPEVYAHRVVYTLSVGEIPDGLVLDHLCRTPACVNPAHLEPVTNRENILRGTGLTAGFAKQTHCKRGHELAGANLYRRPGAKLERGCRTCRGLAKSAYRTKQLEAAQ